MAAMIRMEEWRPVPTHVGIYEVSSAGRVRSMPRSVLIKDKRGREYLRQVRERVLRPARVKGGRSCGCYHSYTLWREHECRVETAHVLVLEAFVGPRPIGMYGCHKDDDGANNVLDNLYWGTPLQNIQDKIANGRQPRGSSIAWAKLGEADVACIRSLRHQVAQDELARWFGIRQSHVSRIQNNHQWLHVR